MMWNSIDNMKWLGAVKQQAITWAKVDRGLCRHMESLGYNDDLLSIATLPATIRDFLYWNITI